MNPLVAHRKIALDLDGTLIDSDAASTLAAFVKTNPDKAFFIVSFRTPPLMQTVSQELMQHDLSTNLFDRIIPMPERYKVDFDEDQQFRRDAGLPRLDQATTLLPGEFRLTHWKGFIASKLGATVLVDDMPYLVIPGCEKFRIAFVDTKRLAANVIMAEASILRSA